MRCGDSRDGRGFIRIRCVLSFTGLFHIATLEEQTQRAVTLSASLKSRRLLSPGHRDVRGVPATGGHRSGAASHKR